MQLVAAFYWSSFSIVCMTDIKTSTQLNEQAYCIQKPCFIFTVGCGKNASCPFPSPLPLLLLVASLYLPLAELFVVVYPMRASHIVLHKGVPNLENPHQTRHQHVADRVRKRGRLIASFPCCVCIYLSIVWVVSPALMSPSVCVYVFVSVVVFIVHGPLDILIERICTVGYS